MRRRRKGIFPQEMQARSDQEHQGGAAEAVRAATDEPRASTSGGGGGGRARAVRQWPLGLQGKLVLSFAAVLAIALGTSCWIFASQGRKGVTEIMGDQARQLSYSLALAGRSSLADHDQQELKSIGEDLLQGRNVLFVAFLDAAGEPITVSSRDAAVTWEMLAPLHKSPQAMTQLYQQRSERFGEYLAMTSPVFDVPTTATSPATGRAPRLLGYVLLGLSQSREQAMLRGVNLLIGGVGVLILLVSLPLATAIVHRVFQPIRELVEATRRIAAGDLAARVATSRPDMIGTLARSFNDMVLTVRAQQFEVEDANARLAQANVQLAEMNAALEQKVHERTGQLEAANRRLSSEIAEKEDFLRAVSHDLNAPLRNISGMATMLLMKHRTKFDEDVVHRLERIQKNVQVETDLISELLELSRIKTRRQKVEVVSLEALIHELADVFEDDLKTRSISLLIDTPMPSLLCERARLRQVFQNLIDNAIKYMGDAGKTGDGSDESDRSDGNGGSRGGRGNRGAREIHVGCDVRPAEAEFYVRDTGIGIDREDLDKVFFVFRRGKSPEVQNVPGKGVGLASVKSIVETYSGSIWVESEPGEGSTFRFTINGQHLAPPVPATTGTPRPTGLAA